MPTSDHGALSTSDAESDPSACVSKPCPGHIGRTPCSDGGYRQTRKDGKLRSHCTKHLSFIRREDNLRKKLQQFFDDSGVDLSDQTLVDTTSNPPPRTLSRAVGPRAKTKEHRQLLKTISNLEHKLRDMQEKHQQLKQSRAAAHRKRRRHSDMQEQAIKRQRREFEDQLDQQELAQTAQRMEFESRLDQKERLRKKLKKEFENRMNAEKRTHEEQLHTLEATVKTAHEAAEREKTKLHRQLAHLDAVKGNLRAANAYTRSLRLEVDRLGTELETCAAGQSRKRKAQYPMKAGQRRAVDLLEGAIDPRKWSVEGLQWVLAHVAVMRDVDLESLVQSIRRLTVDKHKHQGSSTPLEINVQKDVLAFKSLFRATSKHAFALFLCFAPLEDVIESISVEAKQYIIRNWVEKVQSFWSKDRCALLKSATTTSNEKWSWYRALLGRVIVNGKWRDHEIDGVKLPLLWGRWTLDNIRRDAMTEAGAVSSHGGLAVHVDGMKLITKLCTQDLRRFPGLKRMVVKVGADKAGGHKGQDIVSMCTTTNPNLKASSNSALESKILCMYEGAGDDAASMCKYAMESISTVQTILDDGHLKIDDKSMHIDVKFCGDNKFAADAKMLQGAGACYGCDFCHIQKSQFLETRSAELKKCGRRSLQGIKELGHLVPVECCPGCGLKVVATKEEADVLNSQPGKMHGKKISGKNPRAIAICTGDPTIDPPQPWKTKRVSGEKWEWGPKHFSVKYGGDPKAKLLWNAELSCWVICFLHMKLRLTALVFACCVLQWLDRKWKPSPEEKAAKVVDGPQTVVVTELINCMLAGSKITKLEKVATLMDAKVKGSLGGLAVQSYNGPTCNVMSQVSDVLLEVAFPHAKCGPGSSLAQHKKECTHVWDSFKAFMAGCGQRFAYPDGCTDDVKKAMWEDRAVRVEALGKEFVAALKVVHPKNQSLYAHYAAAHCGDQFRQHGYWPGLGMDGIEAKHSVTKLLQRQLTNSKQYQRIKSVVSQHVGRDAAIEKAVDDNQLKDVLELKENQKVARKKQRVQTTSRRIEGRQQDLRTAYDDANLPSDIKKVFLVEQTKRTALLIEGQKEATRLRRKAKKESRGKKKSEQ